MKGISPIAVIIFTFIFLGWLAIPVIIFGICEGIWHEGYKDDVKAGRLTKEKALKMYYRVAWKYTTVCVILEIIIAILFVECS